MDGVCDGPRCRRWSDGASAQTQTLNPKQYNVWDRHPSILHPARHLRGPA